MAIRGCFSQMFVLQKEFLFARGLNWDQSCLWKTPPSHFLLFSPLACPYFFNFFSSPDFWGVKEAPCKNLYVFGENWQRNQFPKLTTFLLHFSPMSPLCHSALVIDWPTYRVEQGLPPHGDVEGDVEVGLVAARVELHIPSHILCVHLYILSRVTLDISASCPLSRSGQIKQGGQCEISGSGGTHYTGRLSHLNHYHGRPSVPQNIRGFWKNFKHGMIFSESIYFFL